MRVLIADSSSAVRQFLARLLRQEGYDVAADVAEGSHLLELLEQKLPEIVFLDQKLPGCNPVVLVDELHRKVPTLSIVMLTTDTDPGQRIAAAQAGAAGFLLKPFTQGRVLEEMRQVAHAHQTLRQLHSTARTPAGARRVVIADDSAALRRLLRAILEQNDCTVVAEADNGQSAVKLTLEHKPDLLCLDVEMPIMSGIEALMKIHQAAPHVPVLMITSRGDKDTVKQAAVGGARGYILKPYQPDKVAEALVRLFARTVTTP